MKKYRVIIKGEQMDFENSGKAIECIKKLLEANVFHIETRIINED